MKKLSIEQKAKRYDEAIERAKSKVKNDKDHVLYEDDILYIFPQLKESEDERISEAFMKHLTTFKENYGGKQWYGIEVDKAIAWLEKQGEQKPAEWDILSAKKGDMLSNGPIVLIVDSIGEFEGKPIINSWYFADSEKFYGKGTSECDRWAVDGFHTATEAECNYLLKMMSDAGYEWDSEKKQLMKIKQKDAWSEEDERMLENTIGLIEVLDRETRNAYTTKEYIDWLKSLRPQSHWRPSEEQMEALRYVTNFDYGGHKATLVSLYEQLKKLREG